jgi:pimeloyl-ACP methyl ester carboxylesterase
MQVLADDGARIEVRVRGRQHRNAVVLIHGFPLSARIFDAQAEALEREFCVVLPDLRGSGSSSSPDGPYLMETLASDVALVLDALGIERAAIAGHSLGGYVALAFARMFTERLERLALIASRLRADTPQEARARRELADRAEREQSIEPVLNAILPRLLDSQTVSERPRIAQNVREIAASNAFAGAAATLRGMALRSPAEDFAEDVDVPVLVVAGAEDDVVGGEEARGITQSFPRGELTVCEGSAHLPMLENPDCVSAALRAWLARTV